eukprot:6207321-Prymnesium_polylepis.1
MSDVTRRTSATRVGPGKPTAHPFCRGSRVSVLTFARCLHTCANTSDGQVFARANTSIQLLLEQSCPEMSGLSRHVRIV